MNTASFDYAVLNDSVAAELETLRAEKQLLTENIRTTEQRLSEISLREEKLARLSESLTDLLTTYPSVANHQASSSESASENGKLIIEETSPATQSNESEIASPAQSFALDSDSEFEGKTVSPTEKTHREFNKTAFFEFYPHLEGAQQPIHILAGKLLEYIGRPTKLRDLTNYILELGYRHSSQNFTNTVHTVLKNKRDRNAGFYFDPEARMWELGHWRSDGQSTTTEKAAESSSETVDQSAIQQTSPQSPKKADKANKIKSVEVKKKTSPKIKVIKAGSSGS